jgi:outer membrane protein TolC
LLCFWSCPVAHADTLAVSPQASVVTPDDQPKLPPLTLEDCYKLALIQSDVVAIQKEAIARATAQIFNATSQALGDVDLIVSRNFQEAQKEAASGSTTVYNDPDISERKFVFSQPLFQGFKAIGALTAAGSFKKEQKEAWIRAKQLLYQDVSFAFYTVLAQKKKLTIIRSTHELLLQRIKELEEREKIGRSRASEVATAWTKLKSLEADLAGTKGGYATAQFLLEFLIGIPVEDRALEDTEPEDVGAKGLEDFLVLADERPDVKAAEAAVKTAKSGIVVAQSGFWPTLNLTENQYLRREGASGNVNWDLLLTMDVPLFSGTATIGQVKDSIAVMKQKKSSLSLAKRQAKLEIKQSYEAWRFNREQYLALKEAVASAEENYKLQSDEYRRSLVNNLDVLAALESLQNTQQEQTRAFYQMKQDESRLKVAIGEVP